jgi:ABC-type Fe3+-hydroxamate transport system substrate-binding protein
MVSSIRRGRWLALASAGLLALNACTGVASPPPTDTATPTGPITSATGSPTAAPPAEPTDTPTEEPTDALTAEPPTEPPIPSPETVEYPLELTDAVGETHVFDGPPEKDGCWWFGCVENMADLGLVPYAISSQGTPTDSAMFFPAGPPEIDVADTNSVEEWAATEAEIFIADSFGVGEQQEAFEQIAPVFHLHTPFPADNDAEALRGLEVYQENLRLMGQITGHPAAADAALEQFESFVAALQTKAPAGAADIEISPLWSSNEGAYFVMPDSEPFCDALATYSLGHCIDATGQLNAEAYLEIDPEWIAYIVFGEDSWEKRTPDPVWGELSAVTSGQIYDASPGGPSRIFCCSLRGLTHALQEYAHHVWGEAGGVPDPGPVADFDPARSGVLEES